MTDLNSPDLLSLSGFERFRDLDPQWFLGAIGNVIKSHCGWHIFPVKSDTGIKCVLGPRGTILLPTLKVVSVEQVSYRWYNGHSYETKVVDPDEYVVHEAGFIEWRPMRRNIKEVTGIQYSIPRNVPYVDVSFTHGYDELPGAVAMVGYEIAMRAMEKPAGIVKSLGAGPYNFQFQELGGHLTESQNRRLAPYEIQGVLI